jgi:hypothetical protein
LVIALPDQPQDRVPPTLAKLYRSLWEQAGGDRELFERLRSEHFAELGKRSGSRRRAKRAARIAAEMAGLEAAAGIRFTSEDEVLALLARQQVKR